MTNPDRTKQNRTNQNTVDNPSTTGIIKSMAKNKSLNIRLTQAEQDALALAAASHSRSISNYLLWLAAQDNEGVAKAMGLK